jgi:hypothetical protein
MVDFICVEGSSAPDLCIVLPQFGSTFQQLSASLRAISTLPEPLP